MRSIRTTDATLAAIACVAIVVAVVLALIVVDDPGPMPGELDWMRWWQRRGEPVPAIAGWARRTTGTEGALVVMALPSGWLINRRGWRGAAAVAIVLLTLLVLQPGIKELVDRPRPSAELVDVRAEHSSESFPSGHSMSTTTVWGAAAVIAARRRRRGLAAVACVPIALTGVASQVQGVHWPSDALAGTLIGLTAALAVDRVLRPPDGAGLNPACGRGSGGGSVRRIRARGPSSTTS